MDEENEVRAYLARKLDGADQGDMFAPPWDPHRMGTTDGYVIATAGNRVFLDADVVGNTVMFSMIHVEQQRRGFGTAVMEALASFAKERGLAVQAYQADNRAFFDTITWLDENGRSTFGPPVSDDDD